MPWTWSLALDLGSLPIHNTKLQCLGFRVGAQVSYVSFPHLMYEPAELGVLAVLARVYECILPCLPPPHTTNCLEFSVA